MSPKFHEIDLTVDEKSSFDDAYGYRVFNPETRSYHTAVDLYFYEDFSHRHDALRQYDRRRMFVKHGLEQPISIDDYSYDPFTNPSAVSSSFLDPDPATPLPLQRWQ
jgi:hypothetical protein